MDILVTGGFGYLGGRIADYFSEKGDVVTILARRTPDYLKKFSARYKVIVGDITKPETLKGCCKSQEIVIHTASLNEIACAKDSREAILVNGYGTRNVLEKAVNSKIALFIYLSTFHIYGKVNTSVINEDILPNSTHNYGISHRLGEMYCSSFKERHNLNTVIFRISNGYGAPIHKNVNRWTLAINAFCLQAYKKKKIVLKSSGKQQRDFIGIPDIFQALQLIISKKDSLKHLVYNVGGENILTIKEVAKIVAEVYEELYREKIEVVTRFSDEPTEKRIKFDIRRLKKLGYSPKAEMKKEIKEIFKILQNG